MESEKAGWPRGRDSSMLTSGVGMAPNPEAPLPIPKPWLLALRKFSVFHLDNWPQVSCLKHFLGTHRALGKVLGQ